jgi:hypothetical protein
MQGAVATTFPAPYGPGIALTWTPTALAGARYYEIQHSTDRQAWTVYTRDRDVSYGGWINHHGSLQYGSYLYALPPGQTYFYRVRVLDAAHGTLSGWSNVISGTVERWNKPPVFEMIPTVTAQPGDLLLIDVTATDPEGRHLVITAADLPSGSVFRRKDVVPAPVDGMGSAEGQFFWVPEDTDKGTYFVWLTARDEFGGESTAMLQIVVCDPNLGSCGFF